MSAFDPSSLEGAETLIRQLTRYWAAKGYIFQARAIQVTDLRDDTVSIGSDSKEARQVFMVRSRTMNGRPLERLPARGSWK